MCVCVYRIDSSQIAPLRSDLLFHTSLCATMKTASSGKGTSKTIDNVKKKPARKTEDNVKKKPAGVTIDNVKKKPAGMTIDNVAKKPARMNNVRDHDKRRRPMTPDEYGFWRKTGCDARQMEEGSSFHQVTMFGP